MAWKRQRKQALLIAYQVYQARQRILAIFLVKHERVRFASYFHIHQSNNQPENQLHWTLLRKHYHGRSAQ